MNPATWSTGVPTIADDAIVRHLGIRFDFNEDAETASLKVGDGDPGSLVFERSSTVLTVSGDLLVGNNGGSGLIDFGGNNDLIAGSVAIGAGAPGTLVVENGEITTNAGLLAVGAAGFDGLLQTDATDVVAGGGFTLGAHGTWAIKGTANQWFTAHLDVIGDLEFAATSTLDLSLLKVQNTIVGDTFDLATYTGTLIGAPLVIPPIGGDVLYDASAPGIIRAVVTATPSDFEWTTGADDYYNAAAWSGGTSPINGGHVFIRNGGSATAAPGGGAPAELRLNSLVVGDILTDEAIPFSDNGALHISGLPVLVDGQVDVGSNSTDVVSGNWPFFSGSLTVTNSPRFITTGDVDVCTNSIDETATATSIGTLTVESVGELSIGGDLDVGAHFVDADFDEDFAGPAAAFAEGHGAVVLRDIGTVFIDGDADITDGESNAYVADGFTGSGRITASHSASFLAENIGNFTIDSCLDVGQMTANAFETEFIDVDVTFRDVDQLDIKYDLDTLLNGAHGTGADAGILEYTGSILFERTDVLIRGDIDLHNTVNISGDGVVQAFVTLTLHDSTLVCDEGDSIEIGTVDIQSNTPGTGAPGNNVEAYVSLDNSLMQAVDQFRLGRRLNGSPANLVASFTLDNGSFLSAGLLEIGSEGTLHYHVDGTDRATSSLSGLPSYSAIDVPFNSLLGPDAASMSGTAVTVEFDAMLPTGTTDFDLVRVTNGGTIVAPPASVILVDLPSGYTQDFFGVTTDAMGDTVLRLTVTGCAADINGDGTPDWEDLLSVLANWGCMGDEDTYCRQDVNADGVVDFDDLQGVLDGWGVGCP